MPRQRRLRRLFFRFYREYILPYKGKFFTVCFLHLLFAGLFIIPPYLVKQLIDKGIADKNLHFVWFLIGACIATYALLALIDKLRVYWGHIVAQKITFNLRNELYSHLQKLSASFYDNTKIGELISRVIDDINIVEEVTYHSPETLLTSGFVVFGTGFILFYLNWKLALVSLIVIPVMAIFVYNVSLNMFRGFREVRKRKASLASRLEDSLSGIRVVQSFIGESYEMKRFCNENRGHYESRVKVIGPMSWIFPGSALLMGISLAIVLGYGGYQVIARIMTIGTLVAFAMYSRQFLWPILSIVLVNEQITRFFASIERYFKYMDIHPDIKDSPESVELQKVSGDIHFKDVWFKYNGKNILENINFHLIPGQTIALVGPSGAGKTTVTRLIPRFYEPYKGRILLDGKDIKGIRLRSLRANIGIVMQNDYIFSGTVLDNIAYGRLDASSEECIEAAKLSSAHQFIKEFSEEYETQAGQRGVKLSAGQAQRISIARAILKKAPVLILDEATSSVDSQTERLIQQALKRLMKGKTCIIIAHRLSTISAADKILFMEDGQVIEEGKHEELLQRGGKYARFYNIQFGLSPEVPVSPADRKYSVVTG